MRNVELNMRDIEDVLEEARQWLETEHVGLCELEQYARKKLKKAFKDSDTPFDAITSRVKSEDSFLVKARSRIELDDHYDYAEVSDLVGLRVIVRVNSELEQVEDVIRRVFHVHKTKRKSKELGRDRLGYRGTHFIVLAKGLRKHAQLSKALRQRKFEIQIRTLCEHAWSQINHPAYKIGEANLGREIERELNLLSGHLELADLRFDQLAEKLDDINREISSDATTPGSKIDKQIEGHTLRALVLVNLGDSHVGIKYGSPKEAEDITSELLKFGFKDLDDLNDRFPWFRNTIQAVKFRSIAGLMRYGMIILDQDRYVNYAWDGKWDIKAQLFHKFELLQQDGVNVEILPHKK